MHFLLDFYYIGFNPSAFFPLSTQDEFKVFFQKMSENFNFIIFPYFIVAKSLIFQNIYWQEKRQ